MGLINFFEKGAKLRSEKKQLEGRAVNALDPAARGPPLSRLSKPGGRRCFYSRTAKRRRAESGELGGLFYDTFYFRKRRDARPSCSPLTGPRLGGGLISPFH